MSHWLHFNNRSINTDQIKWIEPSSEGGYTLHMGDIVGGKEITQLVPSSVVGELNAILKRDKPMAAAR